MKTRRTYEGGVLAEDGISAFAKNLEEIAPLINSLVNGEDISPPNLVTLNSYFQSLDSEGITEVQGRTIQELFELIVQQTKH